MKTMELRAIREHLQESPPPAPSGTSMREWFAGLALMNPMLMAGIPASKRAAEAIRLADELVAALAPQKAPSLESMAAPSEKELEAWGLHIQEENVKSERRGMETNPAIPEAKLRQRTPTLRFGAILPPPMGATIPPVVIPQAARPKRLLPAETRYCSINTERARK